eukprot:6191376-Pleurochrysis_carterae.AAC.2
MEELERVAAALASVYLQTRGCVALFWSLHVSQPPLPSQVRGIWWLRLNAPKGPGIGPSQQPNAMPLLEARAAVAMPDPSTRTPPRSDDARTRKFPRARWLALSPARTCSPRLRLQAALVFA